MDRKGFTLIELLIVVVIIGILAAIAIPRFGETRERAYISAMQSDLNQLQSAQEMYYQDNDFTYSDDEDDFLEADQDGFTDGVTLVINTGNQDGWHATASHTASGVECQFSTLEDDSAQPYFNRIDCDDAATP